LSAFRLDVAPDGLGILTFDLPGEKVNKLSRDVFSELAEILVRLSRDPRVRTLVVRSGKPDVFIAGADLKEFTRISTEEISAGSARGQALFEQIASLPFPTVAAINGVCLGGGTELALACDYRVMSDAPSSRIGLPEVRLGIFPAWGGCVRLPRLVGLTAALDLILTGKQLDARRAKRVGLVDEAVPQAIFEDFVRRFARDKSTSGKRAAKRPRRPPLVSALEATPVGRRIVFQNARKRVMAETGGHYPAPLEAIAVIEESWGLPIEAALEVESRHIANVFGGEVQRNLLNLFFATETVKKETGVEDPAVRPREVTRLGVLGAGLMGGGIAQLAADRGIPARLKDVQPPALAHGFAAAAAVFRESVRKRRLTDREMKIRMARLSGTLDYSGFAKCEVTVEAVVEKIDVKRAVLAEWEQIVPATAIFASNTSTLPIGQIAAAAARPERVAGMHFFNPVHRMPLVEVIRGEKSSDETVATVFSLAKKLGKTPVVVRDLPGFLVNRILAPYLSEAVRLVREGCRVEEVDRVMTDFGMPVGPLALLDDIGLDVAVKAGEVLQAAFPQRIKSGGDEALVAAGRLGRKSGGGFYDYADGKRGSPAPAAYEALRVETKPQPPYPPDVVESRLLLPMVNEAAYCLEDGVVGSPGKLDLAMILGTGFPPFTGGLLRWAESLGLTRVRYLLEELTGKFGPRYEPAPSIRRLADARSGFYPPSGPSSESEVAS
jgi:3-hydroxyacyl-CoA dehydrogenase / enoyl-CoA hydratase / 3-hydroxybutyryl-CoA epimerase